MVPEAISESLIWGPVFALGVLLVMSLFAVITNIILSLTLKYRTIRNSESIDIQLIGAVKGPIMLSIIFSGVALGIVSLMQIDDPYFDVARDMETWVQRIWSISIVAVITYGISRTLQSVLTWYVKELASKTTTTLDDKFIPIVNRILPVLVYTLGLLIILDILTVPISPLLAGLGIGGLGVALALSPSLSSFIAGTYVVTEGQIKENDYIELDNGLAGFVVDVGWRSTRIRSRLNNLVIIPNNKLTDSILTNYSTPSPVLTGIVECGVSYESDLEQVENISIDVTKAIINESELAVKDFEPVVRFSEFGDSNVNFVIIFQAMDRVASFAIKSAIIKNLYARFKQEGIEINYPIRKLVMSPESDLTEFVEMSNNDDDNLLRRSI